MVRTILRTAVLVLAVTACGGDDDDSPGDPDGGDIEEPDAAPADCYENPTTHLEIINACTDAQRIEKDPVLPLLNDDGSLPELPR